MALAGVNLRQEDVDSFLATCAAAGVDFRKIPVWYCCHDDTESVVNAAIAAAVNAGLWVRVWRAMVSDSRLLPTRIPALDIYGNPSGLCGWNEADDESAYPNLPGWVDPWWQWVRGLGRGLLIYYGAPNVDGFLTENKDLEAALDVVCRHIGSTFAPPESTIQGKPTCVSEIDLDPDRFQIDKLSYPWGTPDVMTAAYAELIGCMRRCLQAGEDVYAWGILKFQPDAAYNPEVLQAIIGMNSGAAVPVPTPIVVSAKVLAEQAYNTLTNGVPMVPGKQYVQDDKDGTFKVVVQYPL